MKKIIFSVLLLLFIMPQSFAAVSVYQEKNRFGLEDNGVKITDCSYKKLIRLGNSSFIALKGSKYGIIGNDGQTLVDFKFSNAARLLGKFAKLRGYKGFGLYDENGKEIISPDKDSIELLFGGMFLVNKNYKYGVADFSGNMLIDYICDDIYMPKPNIMRANYKGEWYEIEQVTSETLKLPEDVENIGQDNDFKITKLVTNPISASKYSIVTVTDYSLKVFSSISPAYEATIDELMLSQGAEAVSIFMKIGWLPKFPFVYAKNYYKILRNPVNGPLSDVKNNIIQDL